MKSLRQKIIIKLDIAIKDLAKRRDKHKCQVCGEVVTGSNCHGSHVIPVSAGNKLRWDIHNLKTLCFKHHIGWWHKNPIEAGEWFKKKFPKRHAYLQKNKGIRQFKTYELEELLKKLATGKEE